MSIRKKIKLSEIDTVYEEVTPINYDLEEFFENVVSNTLHKIKQTLVVKGKEYRRNNDPFHNFNEGARLKNITREKVLDGMLLKHEISISDMTNDIEEGILPSFSTVNEKFNDNIIYLILKKASILDRVYRKKQKETDILNNTNFNIAKTLYTRGHSLDKLRETYNLSHNQLEEIKSLKQKIK